MNQQAPPYRAAYVPEDPPMDPEEATGLARQWLLEQPGSSPELVVSWGLQGGDGLRPLQGMQKASLRSRARGTFDRVLALFPDEEVLADAHAYARGGSLVVVESWKPSVMGWARTVGAKDLRSGQVPAPFSEEQLTGLEHLHWVGNNGYAGRQNFGRQSAERQVPEILALGVKPAEILGYLLARGQHGKRVRGLVKTMPQVFEDVV